MSRRAQLAAILILAVFIVPIGARPGTFSEGPGDGGSASVLEVEVPEPLDGYGFDPATGEVVDHNGFVYDYLGSGVFSIETPWAKVRFTFAMTGTYNGVNLIRSAGQYSWTWSFTAPLAYNETGVCIGRDYVFYGIASSGGLTWEIAMYWFADSSKHMKTEHGLTSALPLTVSNLRFWYVFDMSQILTTRQVQILNTVYSGSILVDIPSNAFYAWVQRSLAFNFMDLKADGYTMGKVYLGDGGIIGYSGIPVLGISVVLPDLISGGAFILDPYFSGITKTWVATANGYAGNPANWSPTGVPQNGDNITFSSSSVRNCWFNISGSYGAISLVSGYTGTVSVNTSFSAVSLSRAQGYWAWVSGSIRTVTVESSVYASGGFTNGSSPGAILLFSTTGATISGTGSYSFSRAIYTIPVGVTVTSSINFGVAYLSINGTLNATADLSIKEAYISPTGSILLASGKYLTAYPASTAVTLVNHGSMTGNGVLRLDLYNGSGAAGPMLLSLGVCSLRMEVRSLYNFTDVVDEDYSVYLIGDSEVASLHFSCYDTVSSPVITFFLRGYTFEVGDLTVIHTPRAVIDATDSTLIVHGSLDTSSGVLIASGATVALDGASETAKTASGWSTENLTVEGAITASSSLNATEVLITGSLSLSSGKTLTVNLSGGSFISSGTVSGAGALAIVAPETISVAQGAVSAPMSLTRPSWASEESPIVSFTGGLDIGALTVSGLVLDISSLNGSIDSLTLSYATLEAADATVTMSTLSAWSGNLSADGSVFTFSGSGAIDLGEGSFWNVTVAAGATIDMDNETTVDLRATIDGSMTGTGDFLEPSPAFTSSPDTEADILEVYNYTVTQPYWDTLAIVDAPDWLILDGSSIKGVPTEEDAGFATVSISLTWNDMVTYQNWTLYVAYADEGVLSEAQILILSIVIQLIVSITVLVLGHLRKDPRMTLFGGLIWLFGAVAIYQPISNAWMVLGLGLGLVFMYEGAVGIVSQKD